jgi:hypothetical protein
MCLLIEYPPMNGDNEPRDLTEWDRILKQLAIAAQQQPVNSRSRTRSLANLLATLQKSKKLTRPQAGCYGGMYGEIYDLALRRLDMHIFQRIDSYRSEQAEVLQWANYLLKRQFFPEAVRELMGRPSQQMPTRIPLDELDRIPLTSTDPSLSEQIWKCLEEDPDRLFQTIHVEENFSANFQYIALQRLAGFSWQELSRELEEPIPTLSAFYQRCLKKFRPYFQDYLAP